MLKTKFILFSAVMMLLSACSKQEEAPAPEMTMKAEVIDHPVPQLREGYAGAESCKECHEYQHETWHDSYHRTMTSLATPENVQGNFDGELIDLFGSYVRMERVGDEYWMELESEGQNMRKKVVMITGSHHMQIYWFPSGYQRMTGMVPVVHVNETGEWIPRDSHFLQPPLAPRPIDLRRWSEVCIRCHTTGGNPGLYWESGKYSKQILPNRMETHASEFGISCEACHGPAADHVSLRREKGDGELPDDPIVLPTDLNPVLSSQACGQCHSVNFIDDMEAVNHFFTNGYAFCVGMSLEESHRYVMDMDDGPDHPVISQRVIQDPILVKGSFWADGMVRISGREYNGLVKSPCYTHGDASKQMSCFDCHQMHQAKTDPRARKEWADDQLKTGMREGTACIKCHDGYDTAAHTHHPAESTGSNCLNCHMPYTTYGLLKGIRNHTISSPSVKESKYYGRPNACNLCHLDRTLAWTNDRLSEWYGIDPVSLKPREQVIPASILWLYSGDAGQRALTAHSMGWDAAREASGSDWLAKLLIDQIDDEYDAVRYIVRRSLKKDPRFANFNYYFMALDDVLREKQGVARSLDTTSTAWREHLDAAAREEPGDMLKELRILRDQREVILLE